MDLHMAQNPWIDTRANGAERWRLFCLPFAGGGSQIYRHWPDELPAEIGVYAIQLPGRGARLRESPISTMAGMIAALQPAIAPYLDRPFAFFGHSMGAAIAYEAARHIRGADGRTAGHLFVSGCRAAGLPLRRPPAHGLSDEQFIAQLRELNGTPEEILRTPDLMALLMPMLRADFELSETYTPLPGPALACPLTVFGGRADAEVREEELLGWRVVAQGDFELRLFPGDHYFLQQARVELTAAIARRLGGRRSQVAA
jgi:medium-chain acyl-[acyl-carrier-protein] hydrolase